MHIQTAHDDVIKWKHFPRYRPFVWGIHRSPGNSSHKGQWPGALMFFICAWINGWVNNRQAGDLRRHRAHNDVIVMEWGYCAQWFPLYENSAAPVTSYYRADSRFVPSQWETSLQSNTVSHWLGANLESALGLHPTNERRRYKVMSSLIGWAQTWNQPCTIWIGVSGEGQLW